MTGRDKSTIQTLAYPYIFNCWNWFYRCQAWLFLQTINCSLDIRWNIYSKHIHIHMHIVISSKLLGNCKYELNMGYNARVWCGWPLDWRLVIRNSTRFLHCIFVLGTRSMQVCKNLSTLYYFPTNCCIILLLSAWKMTICL